MCVSTQSRYPEGDTTAAAGIVAVGIIAAGIIAVGIIAAVAVAAAAVLIGVREWSEKVGVRKREG